jgi:hypothetical protein
VTGEPVAPEEIDGTGPDNLVGDLRISNGNVPSLRRLHAAFSLPGEAFERSVETIQNRSMVLTWSEPRARSRDVAVIA